MRNGSDKKQAFFMRFFFLIALEISKRFLESFFFSQEISERFLESFTERKAGFSGRPV